MCYLINDNVIQVTSSDELYTDMKLKRNQVPHFSRNVRMSNLPGKLDTLKYNE